MSTSRTGSLRARPTTRQTHRSGRQRAGPLRYVGPPRPGPLPKCPSVGKMTTDSTYEWRKIGAQVTDHNRARNINPMHLEYRLRNIETNRANFAHGRLPSTVCINATTLWHFDAAEWAPSTA